MFQLLEKPPGRRESSFATSLLVHVFVAAFLFFSVRYTGLDRKIRVHLSPLVAPPLKAEYKPEPVRRPPLPRVPVLQPRPVVKLPPPPEITAVERPPEPVATPAPAIKTNVFTAPVQAVQRAPQQVRTGAFEEAKAEAPRQMAMLKQNVFPGQQADDPTRSAGQVKASGFGAPATLVKPVAGMPSEVAVGNFFHGVPGGPPGRTQGGIVNVGNFGGGGSGGVPGGNGNAASGRVATGGFGNAAVAAQPGSRVQRTSVAALTPVEILSKPAPSYTEEARRLKVEGAVLIQVLFMASGDVRVIGVVRGLGHGLDESAVQAARNMRFRPARQDGQAVDSAGEVEIRFQLAY